MRRKDRKKRRIESSLFRLVQRLEYDFVCLETLLRRPLGPPLNPLPIPMYKGIFFYNVPLHKLGVLKFGLHNDVDVAHNNLVEDLFLYLLGYTLMFIWCSFLCLVAMASSLTVFILCIFRDFS